jgi:methionyl-tRNA synthetase
MDILDKIFDDGKLWKGKYKVTWCDLCKTYIIGCTDPNCDGTSCNGAGCDKCIDDHNEFNKLKTSPYEYLSEEERKVLEKNNLLKKYIYDSLCVGESQINWKRLMDEGKLSEHAEKLFKKEIMEDLKEYYEV